MSSAQIPAHARELIDAYLEETIDAAQLAELETLLQSDPAIRRHFVRYAQAQTDLVFELASRGAAARAVAQLGEDARLDDPAPAAPSSGAMLAGSAAGARRSPRWLAAASLLVGLSIGGAVGLWAQAAPVEPPQPRTLALDFRQSVPATLQAADGAAIGLTARLPGTGARLPAHDPHLRLLRESGRLEVEPTAADLNTRYRLDQAEFPGVKLTDLGFTGGEDFELAVTVVDAPQLAFVGQFGLYAGTAADWAIRGGLVSQRQSDSYRQFLVNTRDGRDKDAYFVGLGAPGDSLRIRLARIAGRYSMAVENQTTGASSTLAIRHPEFLDGRADVVVGLFACEPRGMDHHPVQFTDFSVTVWLREPARTESGVKNPKTE